MQKIVSSMVASRKMHLVGVVVLCALLTSCTFPIHFGWWGGEESTSIVESTTAVAAAEGGGQSGDGAPEGALQDVDTAPQEPSDKEKLSEIFERVMLDTDPEELLLTGAGVVERSEVTAIWPCYTLLDITGDGLPELLYNITPYRSYDGALAQTIAVFLGDIQSGQAIRLEQKLNAGATTGYRGALQYLPEESHLLYSTWSSGTGIQTMSEQYVVGTTIEDVHVHDGNRYTDNYTYPKTTEEISWTPKYDLGPIHELGGTTPSAEKVAQLVDEQKAQGMNVASGTLRTLTGQETLILQGLPEPNPGTDDINNIFAVLLLDAPTTMSGVHAGGGYDEREATMLVLGYRNGGAPKSLEGTHITVSFDKEGWWPSDTSLPLGVLRVGNFRILDR